MKNQQTEYDFRLSYSAIKNVIEVYRDAESILAKERETQLENIAVMTEQWHGKAADTLQTEGIRFFEEGQYEAIYNKIIKMRSYLEEYMPHIDKLRARCAGFVDQLRQDEYVEPIQSNMYQYGDIISVNYTQVSRIRYLCDKIAEENDAVTSAMADTIRSCSGLISGTDEFLERLSAASRKINRITNYKVSLGMYEHEMRALEADMSTDFATIVAMNSDRSKGVSRSEQLVSADAIPSVCGMEDSMISFLKKEISQWTSGDILSACTVLENCIVDRNLSLLEDVAQTLSVEYYEQRSVGEKKGLYYVAALDWEKQNALLQSSVDMHLAGATQYLQLLGGIHMEPLPAIEHGSGSVEFNIQQGVGNKFCLITRVNTDYTVAQCKTEVEPLEDRTIAESQTKKYTEWDRYLDLGLTGYVKYGYHELVAAIPDGLMLIYGNTKETIYAGSVLQALYNDGNLDNVNQHVITNTRTHVDNYIDSFWDNSLGTLEALGELVIEAYDQQMVRPREYAQDVFSGKCEDSFLEQGIKVELGAIQTFLGYPVYTAACNMEETCEAVGTGIVSLADRIKKLPEELPKVVDNTISSAESKIDEVKTTIKEVASMTPEDWGNAWTDGVQTVGQSIKAKLDYLFSEEGMKEVYTVTGDIQGTLEGTLCSDLVAGAVGVKALQFLDLKLPKGGWLGKVDEAIEGGTDVINKLDDVLSSKTLTNQTKKVDNYVSSIKGNAAAKADFDAMNPTNIRTYANGTIAGDLPDGRTINIHPSTTLGGTPSVEIYDPVTGKSIKIRY